MTLSEEQVDEWHEDSLLAIRETWPGLDLADVGDIADTRILALTMALAGARAREAALRERIESLADEWEGIAGRTSDRGRRIAYRTCAYLLHGLLGEAGEGQ